jgi:two-component system, sensor histidine kinase
VALECLRERPIDCVLLDMHMPVLNGEETIRRIRTSRESWSRIPVIALTADVMSGGRAHFEAIGMDGLVGKPIDRADLLTEIYRVLEKDADRSAVAQTAAE